MPLPTERTARDGRDVPCRPARARIIDAENDDDCIPDYGSSVYRRALHRDNDSKTDAREETDEDDSRETRRSFHPVLIYCAFTAERMERAMFIKGILVTVLILTGCAMLYAGAGGTIPYLKYDSLEAYGLPVGALVLLAAIVLAKVWHVETTTIVRTTETSGDGDSRTSIVTEIKKHAQFDIHRDLPSGKKKL
jgi:hypothetical protein